MNLGEANVNYKLIIDVEYCDPNGIRTRTTTLKEW